MTSPTFTVQRALLSVSDKTGIVELAQSLVALNITLLSTGGTAQLLARHHIPVTEVADHTGFPEMLDGRVKTLHPTIHGGLLAQRHLTQHVAALTQHNIEPIDLLVVNLYPFEATVADPACTLEHAIENIDIGGPAMVRSAAKNWKDVAVLTDPSQYAAALKELQDHGKFSDATRFTWSVAAFNNIAHYDAAIGNYLSSIQRDSLNKTTATPTREEFPSQSHWSFVKLQDLRYGENPHQQAAFYRDLNPCPGSLVTAKQLQGKALSYNNIADADAAWECVKSFSPENATACVIVKHANPCGVALGIDCAEAYQKAFSTDPTSAFGGIIAFNQIVDGHTATRVSKQFVEVLIAPGYTEEARAILASKSNVRVLEIALAATSQKEDVRSYELKRIGSGLLIQSSDNLPVNIAEFKVVTKAQPSPQQLDDLLFAWKVAKFVKSNAIVFCANHMTLGVGAGQMSRIDSSLIASVKARNAKLELTGSAVASDAFFPFRDGLDVVVDAGATSVIHPGGSMRDDEVIAAANERGIVMVLTGVRHFRH